MPYSFMDKYRTRRCHISEDRNFEFLLNFTYESNVNWKYASGVPDGSVAKTSKFQRIG
jgi:hypothetical protein